MACRTARTAASLDSKYAPAPPMLTADGQGCSSPVGAGGRPLSAFAIAASRPGGVPYRASAIASSAEHAFAVWSGLAGGAAKANSGAIQASRTTACQVHRVRRLGEASADRQSPKFVLLLAVG